MSHNLVLPHGGKLVDLIVDAKRAEALQDMSKTSRSWDLTHRQVCDLELLMCGGFSPLQGFMSKADYESVCNNMRLADGQIWPMPIVLDLPEELTKQLSPGDFLALRDPEGVGSKYTFPQIPHTSVPLFSLGEKTLIGKGFLVSRLAQQSTHDQENLSNLKHPYSCREQDSDQHPS